MFSPLLPVAAVRSGGVSFFEWTVWLVRKPLYGKDFVTGRPVHSNEDTPRTRSAPAASGFRRTDVKEHGRRRQLRFQEQSNLNPNPSEATHAPRRESGLPRVTPVGVAERSA